MKLYINCRENGRILCWIKMSYDFTFSTHIINIVVKVSAFWGKWLINIVGMRYSGMFGDSGMLFPVPVHNKIS